MAPRVGTVVALVLSCSAAGAAEPSGPRLELRWNAPASCPDALGLIQAIEGFLGQRLSEARAQKLAIDGRVQGDPSHGFAGKLLFDGGQGASERVLEHPDCGKLTEAMALLAAIAIDPERVRARQEAQAAPAPLPTTQPEPEPLPPPPPAVAKPVVVPATPATPLEPGRADRQPPKGSRLQPSVALFGLAGGGMLPGAAPGLGLELGAKRAWFEAAVLARTWASRSAAVPGAGDASVGMSLLSAGLRLCGVPSHGSWSLQLCARADGGRLSGRGEQVDNQRSREAWFGALGGSLGLAYQVGRFSPRIGGELLGALSRPQFGVLREGEGVLAFRPEAWQVAGFVGLAYQL